MDRKQPKVLLKPAVHNSPEITVPLLDWQTLIWCCGRHVWQYKRIHSTYFDHLEVFFTCAALRAYKIYGNIIPRRSRSNTILFESFFFVVYPTTDYALPLTHETSTQLNKERSEKNYTFIIMEFE